MYFLRDLEKREYLAPHKLNQCGPKQEGVNVPNICQV